MKSVAVCTAYEEPKAPSCSETACRVLHVRSVCQSMNKVPTVHGHEGTGGQSLSLLALPVAHSRVQRWSQPPSPLASPHSAPAFSNPRSWRHLQPFLPVIFCNPASASAPPGTKCLRPLSPDLEPTHSICLQQDFPAELFSQEVLCGSALHWHFYTLSHNSL